MYGIKKVRSDEDILGLLNKLINKGDNMSRQKLNYIKSELAKLNLEDPEVLERKLKNKDNELKLKEKEIEELKKVAKELRERMSKVTHDEEFDGLSIKLNNLLKQISNLETQMQAHAKAERNRPQQQVIVREKQLNTNNVEQIDEEIDEELQQEINIRRNNGEETDEDEVRETKNEVRPLNSSRQCKFSPLSIKKFNKYKVVGASLV